MYLSSASVLFVAAICLVSLSASKADAGEDGVGRIDPCRWTGRQCIRNCLGRRDGDYQSCRGCSIYASCVGGRIYDRRQCAPANPPLQWDDYAKRCLYNSSSCTCYRDNDESPREVDQMVVVAKPDDCNTTGSTCIRNCDGLKDGDYQSCNGCTFYASCTEGQLIDRRPCAAHLVWDDVLKRCAGKSNTCRCIRQEDVPKEDIQMVVAGPDDCSTTGRSCIRNCDGLNDGDYQSCNGCTFYASCTNGKFIDRRPCAAHLVWDDVLKRCAGRSNTCRCIRQEDVDAEVEVERVDKDQCQWTGWNCINDCTDLPDGDYQSCRGCSIYASCTGGKIVDKRSCAPANPPLQWDDYLKKCNYTSRTCRCYRQTQKVQKDRLSWSQILKK